MLHRILLRSRLTSTTLCWKFSPFVIGRNFSTRFLIELSWPTRLLICHNCTRGYCSKTVASQSYFCELCQCECSTQEQFNRHLKGNKHYANQNKRIQDEATLATRHGVLAKITGICMLSDGTVVDCKQGIYEVKDAQFNAGSCTLSFTQSATSDFDQRTFEDVITGATLLPTPLGTKLRVLPKTPYPTPFSSPPEPNAKTPVKEQFPIPVCNAQICMDYAFPYIGQFSTTLTVFLERRNADINSASTAKAVEKFTFSRLFKFLVELPRVIPADRDVLVNTLHDSVYVRGLRKPFRFKLLSGRSNRRVSVMAAQRHAKERELLQRFTVPGRFREIVSRFGFSIFSGTETVATPTECPASSQYIKNVRRTLKASPADAKLYLEKLKYFLYLEEVALLQNLSKYDMPNARFERSQEKSHLLCLKIPHLPESLASMLKEYRVFARRVYDENLNSQERDVAFEGVVFDVGEDEVLLGFNQSFVDEAPSYVYNVQFALDTTTIQVQHRALQVVSNQQVFQSVLFPQRRLKERRALFDEDFRCFNATIEQNDEQHQAVTEILRGVCRPAPYIVFGPPGTGKTVTIVEAMLQILENLPSARLLVCTPSNVAADRVTQCLKNNFLQWPKRRRDTVKMLRIYSTRRDMRLVPEELLDFANYDQKKKSLVVPPAEEIARSRIVICTLMMCGKLLPGNLPQQHFSHLFIDEAGQATEQEAFLPIASCFDVTCANGLVVLAGDPMQLSAVVESSFAESLGAGVSLLERLMKSSLLYQRQSGKFDSRVMTKLLRNYRSHKALLHISNTLFYDKELLPCAVKGPVMSFCNWPDLPRSGFPLIFHGVCGEQNRGGKKGFSFYNADEVDLVMYYLERALHSCYDSGNRIVAAKDIGIISPYKAQVLQLRIRCSNDERYKDVMIGSVAEFQGSERMVIILSTVRSAAASDGGEQVDPKRLLGFLRDPKRFNTALTRPKALLIVIGNPYVLQEDEIWKCFLHYCVVNGAYQGVEYQLT